MGWASGSYLADEVWKAVSPHIDIDELQHAAQTIIDLFENHDADDWQETEVYSVAYPFGEGHFSALIVEFDDELAACSSKGKATVKLMIQAANACGCSIIDLIQCFVDAGNTVAEDMDAYCMDVLMEPHTSVPYECDRCPPTEYPPETEENDLFYSLILLCAYGFGGAFQPGGQFEGDSFRDFLAERP